MYEPTFNNLKHVRFVVSEAVNRVRARCVFARNGTSPVTLLGGVQNPGPGAPPPEAQGPKAPPDPLDAVIPKHSMHPAIIHFPIALLIFAALIEVIGARRNLPHLRQTATWALGVAGAGALAAVATGLAAFLRLGMELDGTPLIHLCLALGSTTLIFTTLFFKLRKMDNIPAYWILLVLGAVVVAVTGHFGSLMVYN